MCVRNSFHSCFEMLKVFFFHLEVSESELIKRDLSDPAFCEGGEGGHLIEN